MKRKTSISLHRLTASVALVAYVVAAFGLIPSPTLIARWMGGVVAERYPCESCLCGCGSARECWTSCCCYTPTQRLVWARDAGVTPPAEANLNFADLAFIKKTPHNQGQNESDADCPLCAHADEPEHNENENDVDNADALLTCAPVGGCSASPSPPGVRTISALSCKRVARMLLFTAPPILPTHRAYCLVDAVLPEHLASLADVLRQEDREAPPSPPPRC